MLEMNRGCLNPAEKSVPQKTHHGHRRIRHTYRIKERGRCFGMTQINKLLKRRINLSIFLLIRPLETTLPSRFYQTFPGGTFLSSVPSHLHRVLQVRLRRSPAPKEKVRLGFPLAPSQGQYFNLSNTLVYQIVNMVKHYNCHLSHQHAEHTLRLQNEEAFINLI